MAAFNPSKVIPVMVGEKSFDFVAGPATAWMEYEDKIAKAVSALDLRVAIGLVASMLKDKSQSDDVVKTLGSMDMDDVFTLSRNLQVRAMLSIHEKKASE